MLTIEAAITNTEVFQYLAARAAEYQRLLRRMHLQVNCQGQKADNVVKALCRSEGWTARQLNTIKNQLEGMTLAWKQGTARRIKELKQRITTLEKTIAKEKNANIRHQLKRKLARWQSRLVKVESQLKAGKPNFCFGSCKLFRSQHQLQANGYHNRAEWKTKWQSARAHSFLLVGKAADAAGCNDCRISILNSTDKELTVLLKLRKLNREITTKQARPGDYLRIPVTFRYNILQILAAIEAGQSMSYRFFQREGQWRVQLITKCVSPVMVSDVKNGSLGVDLNPECIAIALVKPDGNPSKLITYDLATGQRTADQTRNELANIVALIVKQAVTAKVPIIIERLDFQQLQKELKSRGLNRRLSRFKFSMFETMIHTRAAKYGIEVISVNPAFTSVIGYFKFGYGNGLNRHESAAVAIARRITRPKGNHFSERIRFRTKHPEAPNPKTLLPPATDGNRHPWRGWRRLGGLLKKSTQYGKTRATASSAGGSVSNDDDLDYSPSVTTVPTQDKPEQAPLKRNLQEGAPVCAPTVKTKKARK